MVYKQNTSPANFQINFHLFPSPNINILNNVRDLFFPVIWFDEGAEVNRNFYLNSLINVMI